MARTTVPLSAGKAAQSPSWEKLLSYWSPQPFTQDPVALASPLPAAENSVNSLPVINSSERQISNRPGPRATNLSVPFPAARFSLTFLEHWGWAAHPVPNLNSLGINGRSFIHSFTQQTVTAHCAPATVLMPGIQMGIRQKRQIPGLLELTANGERQKKNKINSENTQYADHE